MKRSGFLRHQTQMRSRNSNLCDVMPNQNHREELDALSADIHQAIAFCEWMHQSKFNMKKAGSRLMASFPRFSKEGAQKVLELWKEHRHELHRT